MPKIITYDFLRTLPKDTLVELVLELRDKFDIMELRSRRQNRTLWQLRDKIEQLQSKRNEL